MGKGNIVDGSAGPVRAGKAEVKGGGRVAPAGLLSLLRSLADGLPFWARELIRKTLHIGVVILALPLHWWGWWYGIIFAVAAGFWNGYGMPRFFRFTFREDEERAGYSRGMLSYPLIVLILIIFFPLPIAASQWATLSFGDGFATLVGRFAGKRHLPWNKEKTLAGTTAFFIMGTIGATFFFWFTLPNAAASSFIWHGATVLATISGMSFLRVILICALSTAAAAVFETIPFAHVDDNVAAPLAGAVTKLLLCFLL